MVSVWPTDSFLLHLVTCRGTPSCVDPGNHSIQRRHPPVLFCQENQTAERQRPQPTSPLPERENKSSVCTQTQSWQAVWGDTVICKSEQTRNGLSIPVKRRGSWEEGSSLPLFSSVSSSARQTFESAEEEPAGHHPRINPEHGPVCL